MLPWNRSTHRAQSVHSLPLTWTLLSKSCHHSFLRRAMALRPKDASCWQFGWHELSRQWAFRSETCTILHGPAGKKTDCSSRLHTDQSRQPSKCTVRREIGLTALTTPPRSIWLAFFIGLFEATCFVLELNWQPARLSAAMRARPKANIR